MDNKGKNLLNRSKYKVEIDANWRLSDQRAERVVFTLRTGKVEYEEFKKVNVDLEGMMDRIGGMDMRKFLHKNINKKWSIFKQKLKEINKEIISHKSVSRDKKSKVFLDKRLKKLIDRMELLESSDDPCSMQEYAELQTEINDKMDKLIKGRIQHIALTDKTGKVLWHTIKEVHGLKTIERIAYVNMKGKKQRFKGTNKEGL